jgi:hypothetical protein
MAFPDNLGTIACTCVISEGKPVLFVSHAGGDWQMYCHWKNHDFGDPQVLKNDLKLIHIAHLVALDPSLDAVSDLPAEMAAERERVGGPWERYADTDDE